MPHNVHLLQFPVITHCVMVFPFFSDTALGQPPTTEWRFMCRSKQQLLKVISHGYETHTLHAPNGNSTVYGKLALVL